MRLVKRNKKRGQGLVEYALLIALIALAVMSTLLLLSGTLQTNYIDRIPAALERAMPTPT